jgi:hypothetical protein
MKKAVLLFLFFSSFISADWQLLGLSDKEITAIAIDPSNNNNVYASASGYLYKSSDAGTSWVQDSTIYGVYDIEVKSDGTVYVTCYNGTYKSTDSGTNWTLLGVGAGYLCLVPPNTIIVSQNIYSENLMISTDGGTLWSTAVVPCNSYDWPCDIKTNGTDIFFAIDYNYFLKSSDTCTTFVTIGAPGLNGYPYNVYYPKMALVGNDIFIASASGSSIGVFRYNGSTGNWTEQTNGITNKLNTSITYPGFGAPIYVGSQGGGIFKSTNNGTSWVQDVAGLLNYNINVLESCSTAVYAGTPSGIYKTKSSITITTSNSQDISLKPINNLINPGKSEICSILWSIAVDTGVSLKIFNLKGELIKTVIDGETKTAGSYQNVWDGKDSNGTVVSSGIYFAYLKAGGKNIWKKIAVVK